MIKGYFTKGAGNAQISFVDLCNRQALLHLKTGDKRFMASLDEALAIIKRGIDELIPEEELVEKLKEAAL